MCYRRHDKASTRPKRRHNCTGPKISQPEWGNMRCSKCGSDNREGRKFCTSCGTPLVAACPNCGAPIQPGERFCGECGAPLRVAASCVTAHEASAVMDDAARPLAAANTPPDGERQTITALFADIKGSTELM